MLKLIVSDIDGTLLPDGSGAGVMNEEYFDVIRKLHDKGITFVACSGRQFHSMMKVFEPVRDIISFICEGGGYVCDGYGNELHSCVIDKSMVKELVTDAFNIPKLDVMVAGIKRSYCRYEDSELYKWMTEDYGFDIEAVGDDIFNVDDDVTKVSLYHHNAVEELTKDSFVPKWETRLKTILAGIQWLDCVSFSSGKGTSVSFLQRHLNVTPDETIVFGDNQNDIEMFSYAKTSYAVANARDEVIQAADEVCEAMEKDGVLEVLRKY